MLQSPTPIVRNLIIINLLVFMAGQFLGERANGFLVLYNMQTAKFNPIQFFTYMFVHGDFYHLFGNMLSLYFFGTFLERYWGDKKFLIYYTVCGIGAGVLYAGYVYYETYHIQQLAKLYFDNPTAYTLSDFMDGAHSSYLKEPKFFSEFAKDPTNSKHIEVGKELVDLVIKSYITVPMGGASGAIFGVMLAVGFLFPYMEVYLFLMPPIKMIYLVVVMFGVTIYNLMNHQTGDNVAHFAHLSGIVVGLIMLIIWRERRINYY